MVRALLACTARHLPFVPGSEPCTIVSLSFSSQATDFGFKTDFDDLDLTTEAIDFGDVDDDLEKFQQDDILRKVLSEVHPHESTRAHAPAWERAPGFL